MDDLMRAPESKQIVQSPGNTSAERREIDSCYSPSSYDLGEHDYDIKARMPADERQYHRMMTPISMVSVTRIRSGRSARSRR